VNPDADSTMGGIAFRTPVWGGGFTDTAGGRGDLPTIDISGLSPHGAGDVGPIAHVDPDAGGDIGILRPVVLGGGFTDVRPDLPTIDLSGVSPVVPQEGTDAFGMDGDGSAAFTAHGFAAQMDGGSFQSIDASPVFEIDDAAMADDVAAFDAPDAGFDPGADQQGFGGDGPLPFP
jgi:hypothetical protein